ncbi:membrane protein [Glycocaulis albus]|jgi:O-acetylserine/cysteine efflux transporter|uniref:Membrane protein n=1 Tax=Glycocaulis albus TaxID=1382801 RepID=A0ABQ1XPJ9_9PROT|nr:EamA family transporter [Glycocaulis albus]MBV5258912.1 EamA family transporter [Synechococcus moorigangaii CMS01]GGG99436.1 membrane protein [Glycocaulis albus]
MSPRHFALLFAVCLVWGVNFVVAKWSVSGTPDLVPGFDGVPPLFFAFIRFALLYAMLAPWLLPLPKKLGPVIGAGLGMGAIQFALLFTGLHYATPSAIAIVVQLSVPFTTILSIMFLKEKVGWVRAAGMGMAFAGASLVVFKPAEFTFTAGLLAGVGAAMAAAAGSIFVKRVELTTIPLQAWIGLFSWPPLLIASLIFERGQIEAMLAGGWLLLASIFFTVLLVNIFGHGAFYWLLRRYDASLIAPMTLMGPLIGVISGVVLLGDPVSWQLIAGGLIAIAGVAVVAARRSSTLPPETVIQKPR